MSTTVREAATDLLGYLGPKQRTYPHAASVDDPIPSVLAALNGAKDQLAILGPEWCTQMPRAERLRAPYTTASTTWAVGATTVVVTDAADWMVGCTIRFGLEPFNQIISRATTTLTLLNPFLAAGSGTGIVYQDCVTVATDVLEVMKPVNTADGARLEEVGHPSSFNSSPITRDYGMNYRGDYRQQLGWQSYFYTESGEPIIADRPRFYFVDNVWGGSTSPPVKRIRVSPMPSVAQILQYRVRATFTKWVQADIFATLTPTVDPAVNMPFEDARVSSIFLPIARFRFAAMPVMADSKARPQIIEDYKVAMQAANALATKNKGVMPTFNPEW